MIDPFHYSNLDDFWFWGLTMLQGVNIDSNLLLLLNAARYNSVATIQSILKKHPNLINAPDPDRQTPLHCAVAAGHIESVRALLILGADVTIGDNWGFPPMGYAANFPDIQALLKQHGAVDFDTTVKDIHIAALNGDEHKIREIVKAHPEKLHIPDSNGYTPLIYATFSNNLKVVQLLVSLGAKVDIYDHLYWSPLFYAAAQQNKTLVNFFLENGANPDALTKEQENVVSVAEPQQVQTPLSAYLKKRLDLPKTVLNNLTQQFKALLTREIHVAKSQGKKIIVMLGEAHFAWKIMQLEKCFLQVANELGIHTLLVEDHEKNTLEYPSDIYAKNALAMKVVGIDNYPKTEEFVPEDLDKRNEVMAKNIHKHKVDAVLRIGAAHMHGLLENPKTQIDNKRFHLMPFNLSCIGLVPIILESAEYHFFINPNRVIQVRDDGISYPETALQHWNKPTVPANEHAAVYLPLKELKRKVEPTGAQENKKSKSAAKIKK